MKGLRLTKTASRRQDAETGASLVEFALALPLLLALIFGLIEMSWAFAQLNDVRHGAREGARAAAVDVGDVDAIGQLVCARMDTVTPDNIQVTLSREEGDGKVGARGLIRVTAEVDTITGFYDFLLSGRPLSSEVQFRLEQPARSAADPASWWADIDVNGPTYDCSP